MIKFQTNFSDNPIRVVIADPQAVVRAGMRLFLEQSGQIQVLGEAADGESARNLIQETAPDVLVLEITLPKISGLEIARQVRANRWPIKTLIFTACEEDPYLNAFLKSGANGYLLKTASPQEIVAAVTEVSQGKTSIDRAVLPRLLTQTTNSQPGLEALSNREIEILSQVAQGFTNKVIGFKLSISDRTVQGHIARIFEKLQASSRTDAVMRAIASGIIPPPEASRDDYYSYEI